MEKIRSSTNKKKFFYLDQITSYNSNKLIKYHHFSHLTGHITKVRIPNWYLFLSQQSFNFPLINPPIVPNNKKKFLATTIDNNTHIGKKQKKINNNTIQITHQI